MMLVTIELTFSQALAVAQLGTDSSSIGRYTWAGILISHRLAANTAHEIVAEHIIDRKYSVTFTQLSKKVIL
jgi:hypothetical protein